MTFRCSHGTFDPLCGRCRDERASMSRKPYEDLVRQHQLDRIERMLQRLLDRETDE